VIVNKVLANETNKTRVDSILESFFAGCRKYDLYELAKKYYTIPPNDLFQIQQAIGSKESTREQIQYALKEITTIPQVSSDNSTGGAPEDTFKQFLNKSFYFNNAIPKPKGDKNFGVLYESYIKQKPEYETQSKGTETTLFFNNVIIPNKNVIDGLIDELEKQFTNSSEGNVTIVIDATTSAKASLSSNDELSARRIDSAISYITNNSKMTPYVNGTPKRLIVVPGVARGESAQPESYDVTTKTFFVKGNITCTDKDGGDNQAINNEVFTTSAMACRRAYISSIKSTLKAPPAVLPEKKTTVVTGNVVTKTETTPVIETTVTLRDNISKRVLRSLLSECDYFETIKEESPLVYDNLKDKLKFFQPGFHSITPEGLNSRLTFLQQCMRPGDTIPTIRNENGSRVLTYNDATNTSFGAPPVLILRVGDFYNTKVIPKSLSFTYEDLDLNPEGIGVQPMIANVTLTFDFVGGSGLKESVDKLQNALTFNYYANTEIYDDRADSTDLSYKVIDQDFLKSVIDSVAPPTINQSTPNNGQSNNKTIGDILTTVVSGTSQTGTTSYSVFMDKVVEESQNYFTNVVNKNRESFNQYNNAVRQQWMAERIYQKGKFTIQKETETILFGKPNNLEKRTDEIFKQLIKDIKAGDEGFIEFISDKKYNFTNRLIRQVKENYSNFVNNKRGSFQSAITNITNGMVNVQQNYIGYVGRINTITYNLPSNLNTGTDGYQTADGKVINYIISGTTEIDPGSTNVTNTLDELKEDVKKIKSGITEFNTIVWSANTFISNSKSYTGILVFEPNYKLETEKVFNPFSQNGEFQSNIFRRVYMIVSNDVVDSKKYESFKNALIGNILSNTGLIGEGAADISNLFDAYWLGSITLNRVGVKSVFEEENKITKDFIDDMEKNKLKDFLKYTPFNLKKKRVFTYTTENANTDAQQKLIKGLGWTENQNTNNKTWNDESPANVFISKAKLN
jgi:hypothetical protein